jgi:hypothetical protein
MAAVARRPQSAGTHFGDQQIVHTKTAVCHCRRKGISTGTGVSIKRFTAGPFALSRMLALLSDEPVGDE